MAKHPVPKQKTAKTKSKVRHSAFAASARKKLFGAVDKMKSLEKKGNLELRKKNKEQLVKKIQA
ncbi:hypothetical protein GF376_00710 [Candidatus Peregrinibacteria bacterium]|nr:hypothetical protein [Candidatus Peregrinibacteria bacterium]